MNKLCPFTQNQVDWFNRSLESWFNMAEGGKRAGKNILEVQSFCAQLEDHPDKLHLVSGFSIATAKLNVIDCDGLGVANYFEGRCEPGKYEGRDCLYVHTKTGEKVLLISGGGKASDYKLIKGNTYGMALITEANECHPSFIKEVFDRTLTSSKRRIFHDLNPKTPKDWYYTEIEEFHKKKQEKNAKYGFNYGHFTIADNLSISNVLLKVILNTYDKLSLWFKRDILGLRVIAEGLVYPKFANNKKKFVVKEIPKHVKNGFIIIGVDFGGNKSGHAFNATLIASDFRTVGTIADYWNDKDMDAEELTAEFIKFIRRVQIKFPQYSILKARADSAEQVLIRSFRNAMAKQGIGFKVENAIKGLINNRIRFYNKLIGAGAYFILDDCKHTIDAFESALWAKNDKQEDERLDDGTTNIDTLDSQEYSTEEFMKAITDILDLGKAA